MEAEGEAEGWFIELPVSHSIISSSDLQQLFEVENWEAHPQSQSYHTRNDWFL